MKTGIHIRTAAQDEGKKLNILLSRNRISKLFRSAASVIIILSLLTVTAAGMSRDTVYSNSFMLADNLEFINSISYNSSTGGRRESFALRVTGPGDAYPIIMRSETVFGRMTISDMVSYAEGLGKNVLAAVNTDFFSLQTGVPMGILIEDGEFVSSWGGRNAICFAGDGSAFFLDNAAVEITLYNEGGSEDADNEGQTVKLTNFNKFRTDTGGMVLLTELFSDTSTRTSTPGWFVRLRILEGKPSVSGTMTFEVSELIQTDTALPIGEGYMMLTSAAQSGFGAEFEKFAVGDIVTMTTVPADERLIDARFATGGGDILVSGGIITDAEDWDRTIANRAPRTAFGIKEDGSVISYVIDGRSSTHSVGMTMEELAEEMLRQGAVYAVNFDGGGSTALSIRLPGNQSAAVVSRPSDGTERPSATFMLFVTDVRPDGVPRNLSLRNDGIIVLAGSSLVLDIAATDRGYMPVGTPADVLVTPSEFGAQAAGMEYTAGQTAGRDILSLRSATSGASGNGSIFVITRPTSITITRKGSDQQLSSVRLSPGQELELSVTATYYRRAVIAQPHSFLYTVSGNIGEMTEAGVFRAGPSMMESGSLTISAGGLETMLRVEVGGFIDMQDHWAREYAEYLYEAGITIGISETQYGPEYLMRRGDYILMLHRAAGLPEPSSIDSFDDVPSDEYYAEAINWAKETGIVFSISENNFQPERPLTRQEAFEFTFHALDILNKEFTEGSAEDLYGFSDADLLDENAVVPTATLVLLGIIEGMDGMLAPEQTMTRAQMAKVISMVMEL